MITTSTSATLPIDWSQSGGTTSITNTSCRYTKTTTINDKDEGENDDDKLLYRCFRHQGCGKCLDEESCSWCPFTQSCIPNRSRIPLLAPAFNENICPHWTERWEIRTRPLGCQVSTITALTGLISILSTLLFLGLVFLVVWTVRWVRNTKFDSDRWVVRPAKGVGGGLRRGVGKFAGVLGVGRRHAKVDSNDVDNGSRFEEGSGRLPVAEAEGVHVGEREPLLRR